MDAITDDTNLWLRAVRSHDSGDYLTAFTMYINDAAGCLKKGAINRAALSCSCAADCLMELGMPDEGRRLYYESAMLSKINAQSSIGTSIRESLWSLLQSYDRFLLAGDNNEAEKVYLKYISLARRTNPIDGEAEATETLRLRRHESRFEQKPTTQDRSLPKQNLPSDLVKVRSDIEKFVSLRNKLEISAANRGQPPTLGQQRNLHVERSIIS
jgi:hypothetical protein